MERITITIDADLLALVDARCAAKGYSSRSEAIRDLLREAAGNAEALAPDAHAVATLSYVYDHETRDLARRLTNRQHDHHDLSIATLHVHLDRHECLEVSVLRGRIADLRSFADGVTSQRGVRHGSLHLLPHLKVGPEPHDH